MKSETKMNGLLEQVSDQKFHRLYWRDLAVALEATFAGDTPIKLVGEVNFPELIFPAPEIHLTREEVRRVYHPAIADGDMAEKTEGKITFLPWVDETEVQFHRLVFRLRPAGGNKKFRWVKFGRFGEDSAFGFNVLVHSPYINLDFMSKRAESFVPLFAKVHDGGSGFVYFELSAEVCEEAITLKVKRVAETEAPPPLAEAKPSWLK